jgi:hypothetical protein
MLGDVPVNGVARLSDLANPGIGRRRFMNERGVSQRLKPMSQDRRR